MTAPKPTRSPIPGATDDTVLTPALRLQGRERAQPVVDWLLAMRLRQHRITLPFDGFVRQLPGVGVPLDRRTLSLAQLHPHPRARTVLWDAQAGARMDSPPAHGVEEMEIILQTPVRLDE